METKLGTVKCPAIIKVVNKVKTIHGITVDIYDLHDGGFRIDCPDHPFTFRTAFKNTLEIN